MTKELFIHGVYLSWFWLKQNHFSFSESSLEISSAK